MRSPWRLALFALPFITSVLGQDAVNADKKSFDYQSDVSRLRKIVINSLYSQRDVFLRELVSNANDALEKLRITSLTDKNTINEPLNITIKLIPDAEGKGGRVVITDTGVGMSSEDLTNNLGTLAKSGTSEFLDKAEKDVSGNTGNLIGQFGVGFYSSFLVADRVYVASRPHASKADPNPVQHVFSSSADDSSFDIYPDPRGNTLQRGTEITMVLKPDALEFLEGSKVKELIEKHSAFSTSYPIYLFEQRTEEVPDPSYIPPPTEGSATETTSATTPDSTDSASKNEDDDEKIVVEDVEDDEGVTKKEDDKPQIPTISVTTDHWVHLNDQPPLWTRDPKNVTKDEYDLFYRAAFKDSNNPLALHHFKGDSGSGISFKAILFVPPTLGQEFWQSAKADTKGIKLMVKRVFITSDLGEDAMPKWISWLRAIVDADDLPLNVSRETLQSTKFLAQVKSVLIKRFVTLLEKIARDDDEKFKAIYKVYGAALKIGAMENGKEKNKLVALTRWETNNRNFTSLEQYVANRKKGQKQIFYLAGVGQNPADLAQSVFVEKLHARGYEVLLLVEPMDEILFSNLRTWKGMQFQDAAKKGLKFGDEDVDSEEEKKEEERLAEKFAPLTNWLKEQAGDTVMGVVISNRLVTSPCAVVADSWGYSANMERLMAAQNGNKADQAMMHEWAKKQKFLEINPKSPLIEGMLRKVEEITPAEGEEKDEEAEKELKEATSILIDSALIRSGYPVPDSNIFFAHMDRVLRRSLGVSEHAKTDARVAPAPPVESGPLPEDDEDDPESQIQFKPKPAVVVPGTMPDAPKAEAAAILEEVENLDKIVVDDKASTNGKASTEEGTVFVGGEHRKVPDLSKLVQVNAADFAEPTIPPSAVKPKAAKEEKEEEVYIAGQFKKLSELKKIADQNPENKAAVADAKEEEVYIAGQHKKLSELKKIAEQNPENEAAAAAAVKEEEEVYIAGQYKKLSALKKIADQNPENAHVAAGEKEDEVYIAGQFKKLSELKKIAEQNSENKAAVVAEEETLLIAGRKYKLSDLPRLVKATEENLERLEKEEAGEAKLEDLIDAELKKIEKEKKKAAAAHEHVEL